MRRLFLVALITLFAISGLPSAAQTPSETITISASGDVLVHNTLYSAARTDSGYNFYPLLRKIRSFLQTGIDICHLETPLTAREPSNYPVFATPREIAKALKQIGFEGCSVASNHTLDRGVTGIKATQRFMQAVGLKTAGTRMKESDSAIAFYETPSGNQVAQLSYTFGYNGFSMPTGQEWRSNLIDPKAIKQAAAYAREQGAELVIVSLHWGNEYQSTPSEFQKRIAKNLTKSPNIDAIIGHHAHVIQPAKLVNGKPVLFGLGNLWSGQGPWADMPTGHHGVIAKLQFELSDQPAKFLGGQFIPTITFNTNWVIQPAAPLASTNSAACDSIENSAEMMSDLLTGPMHCD